MKAIIFLLLVVVSSLHVSGQGFFNQKGAQIKNMLKQIALLQVHIVEVEKVYATAKAGLKTISDIKKGDFDMHQNYIASLSHPSAVVTAYAASMDIDGSIIYVKTVKQKLIERLAVVALLDDGEMQAVRQHFDDLLHTLSACKASWQCMSRPDSLSMNDAERMECLRKIGLRVIGCRQNADQFAATVLSLAMERKKISTENKALLTQY